MMNVFRTASYELLSVACIFIVVSSFLPLQAPAQEFQQAESSAVKVRLISAETGVAAQARTLSLGLDIVLEDGWKTYWRSPGAIGLPPELDWTGSENVADIQILFPAPKRFTAFEIENFGYEDRVVLPISATLENPGEAVAFRTRLTLLVCGNVCIPQDFDLSLELSDIAEINEENSDLIATYLDLVPDAAENSDVQVVSATLNGDFLTVTAQSQTRFMAPDFFPELGPAYTFGKPDIRVDATRMNVWAQLPLLSGNPNVPSLRLTLTDGERAVTLNTELSAQPPPKPFGISLGSRWILDNVRVIVLACLGGLILYVVLQISPVLSNKTASIMSQQKRAPAFMQTRFVAAVIAVLAVTAGLMFLM